MAGADNVAVWVNRPVPTGRARELRGAGFSWESFNDTAATCSVDLSTLEDRFSVPRPIRNRILEQCRVLPLRLNFITGRGLHAVAPARTITDLPNRPSDHLPITCELDFKAQKG